MKWSWKVGRFAGIDVYVHVTFALLIVWIGIMHWIEQGTTAAVISGTAFVLAIFLCVVLHEYGHALMARRYGVGTRDITLLPIGGVARLERMPEKPAQEFWVALAGPAVNVSISILLFCWLAITGTFRPITEMSLTQGPFLERLMLVNLGIVVFNLIPAFPMDGGRLLRAALALRMEHERATRMAASLGQSIAVVFGVIGLFGNPLLVFIAVFVWFGAAQEAAASQMQAAIGGAPVHSAMVTDFHSLNAQDTVSDAATLMLRTSQQEFPILDQGRVVGILPKQTLLRALAEHGETYPVKAIMVRDVLEAKPGDMLAGAFPRMMGHHCQVMLVVDNGRLVGLVTSDNLGEFFLVQAARRRQGSSRIESLGSDIFRKQPVN